MSTPAEATPQDAFAAVSKGDGVLLDVREPWEYEQVHIPGAVLIPLAEIPDRLTEVPSDQDVYVHCRLGGRSGRAVEYLREQGRPRTINVLGGIEAWQDAGLPTS
ncbi:MAG: rhodanese-like domain-containing protein [Candidatus Dormibacteria bacterium]